jgi:phosphoadenosine phosphosulfate reductase
VPTKHPEIETLAAANGAEALSARELVGAMMERFHPRIALACSFQKEEAILLHMLLEMEPRARVFALDTGVLFPETYAVWREVEKRYGITIETVQGPSLGRQAAAHGDALWERNPDLCCAIRKVEPLTRMLGELDAWIVGIRRDQSPMRAHTPRLGWDERFEIWKAAPLADWCDHCVTEYIQEHELPTNPLHDQGYASIGCTHCTKPGSGREGRWAGTEKSECGLHKR